MDFRRTTRLTIPHTNKEMITSLAVNNDSVMGLDLKGGVYGCCDPCEQVEDVDPHRYENDHEITCDPGRVPRHTQNTNVK